MSQKIETTSSIAKTDRSGLVPGFVHLALDLAEKVAAAFFRLTRKSIQRVDDASAETLSGVGQVLTGAVKSARETTRAAAELATTATSGVTGHAHAQA